jgi:peptidoglycan/xylan/chitin deacetylase (PgdA/CDA1 family)
MGTISLIFDNGPEPAITDFVLDTLGARDIHATFFLIGSKLEQGEPRDNLDAYVSASAAA